MNDQIILKNAHLNNLKNVNLKLPKNQKVVFCGISGSGKSTLVFDTIFKEGQKRYIESLSSYARQYLDFYTENKIDSIIGLSPSISIDQKSRVLNPRSTVGTLTEITDNLRVLFSTIGKVKESSEKIPFKNDNEIIQYIANEPFGKVKISFEQKNKKAAETLGITTYICSQSGIPEKLTGDALCLFDKFTLNKKNINRLTGDLQLLRDCKIKDLIIFLDNKKFHFSRDIKLSSSEISFDRLTPNHFSYNSPKGSCQNCKGLGEVIKVSPELLFDKSDKNILDNSSTFLSHKGRSIIQKTLIAFIESSGLPNQSFFDYDKKIQKEIMFGSEKNVEASIKLGSTKIKTNKKFQGLTTLIKNYQLIKNSLKENAAIDEISSSEICPNCKGSRLGKHTHSVFLESFNLPTLSNTPLIKLEGITEDIYKNLSTKDKKIAEKIFKAITEKVRFLNDVGLGYLTLNRSSKTLSGGESQRIRLANQISSKLSGILYVLDEPSIGLHPCDNSKLLKAIDNLKKMKNTVLIVEHDEDTIKSADYIIEVGPRAGKRGGEITFEGSYSNFKKSKSSLTSQYLFGDQKIHKIDKAEFTLENVIHLKGANHHNLKDISVKIPLDAITVITGPSGSGKSTFVHEVLSPALKTLTSNRANQIIYRRKNLESISGTEKIRQVIELTQNPIGRSPKSNPSTYIGIFDEIRRIFSQTNESKIRGYTPSHFSFNVSKGRCDNCEGNGFIKTEMQFLPDVLTTCNICLGSRFKEEINQIKFKGFSISDILLLEASEALNVFKNHPKIYRPLKTMEEIGLGYLTLGQPSTTLSGGEAQRIKLAKEISKKTKGHTIYLLDEPTTGLHFDDISKLLVSFEKLRDNNASVVIIEHNKDIINNADYIIDLGPSGGENGGQVVYQGELAGIKKTNSLTGKYL